MRELTTADDFETIQIWLNTNLKENKSFVPCKDELKNINSKDNSKSKGIYFWFMRPEGYVALRNFVPINAIEPKYTRIIDNIEYDLVYLGTTGTGKQGKNNFYGRLNWHINQVHRESTIRQKQSALSTLRTGLGSLLADDLINPTTETDINNFMKTYMKVFWIVYPDNKTLIDNDEKILIKKIKPLLNLKHNPNHLIGADNNPTKEYRARRNSIEIATKKRLGFQKTKDKTITKSEKVKEPIKSKAEDTKNNNPKKSYKNLNSVQGLIEFTVKKNERISDISNNPNFPVGKLTINIRDTKSNNVVYSKERKITKVGRTLQKYFISDDASGLPKWQVIQNEMKQNNIEEITVRVCPIN
jgi:hypothetical protein